MPSNSPKRKSRRKQGAKVDDEERNLTPKLLRSVEPDLIVAVGGVEYNHYKVILCDSCDYFDAMLSTGMKEDQQNRVEFPDKDPDEWPLVYSFLDPPRGDPDEPCILKKITKQNATILMPWFDFLGLHKLTERCDELYSHQFEQSRRRRGPDNLRNSLQYWHQCGHLPRSVTKELVKDELLCELENWTDHGRHKLDCVKLIKPLLLDADHGNDFWNALWKGKMELPQELKTMNRREAVENPFFEYLVLAADSLAEHDISPKWHVNDDYSST